MNVHDAKKALARAIAREIDCLPNGLMQAIDDLVVARLEQLKSSPPAHEGTNE